MLKAFSFDKSTDLRDYSKQSNLLMDIDKFISKEQISLSNI